VGLEEGLRRTWRDLSGGN